MVAFNLKHLLTIEQQTVELGMLEWESLMMISMMVVSTGYS